MPMPNRARFIDRGVKRLTRHYGKLISFVNPTTGAMNYQTGKRERSFTTVGSVKALVHPSKADHAFAYDLSYLAANKNFVYGGLFERGKIDLIVRTANLTNFDVNLSTFIMIDGEAYVIGKITNDMAGDYIMVLTVQRTENADLGRTSVVPVPGSTIAGGVDPTVVIA